MMTITRKRKSEEEEDGSVSSALTAGDDRLGSYRDAFVGKRKEKKW